MFATAITSLNLGVIPFIILVGVICLAYCCTGPAYIPPPKYTESYKKWCEDEWAKGNGVD